MGAFQITREKCSIVLVSATFMSEQKLLLSRTLDVIPAIDDMSLTSYQVIMLIFITDFLMIWRVVPMLNNKEVYLLDPMNSPTLLNNRQVSSTSDVLPGSGRVNSSNPSFTIFKRICWCNGTDSYSSLESGEQGLVRKIENEPVQTGPIAPTNLVDVFSEPLPYQKRSGLSKSCCMYSFGYAMLCNGFNESGGMLQAQLSLLHNLNVVSFLLMMTVSLSFWDQRMHTCNLPGIPRVM